MVRTLLWASLLLGSLAGACGRIDPGIHARVEYWAKAHGLDPILLAAVVWVESRYCPQALGRAGEIGLGQVKPVVALQYGVDPQALWDPDTNLWVAARYLRDLYLRFGRWDLALGAYNRGPTRVAQEGLDSKGLWYARAVLSVYHGWKVQ